MNMYHINTYRKGLGWVHLKPYGLQLLIEFHWFNATESPQGDSLHLASSPQDFLVLNLSTSEWWKAESALKYFVGEPRVQEKQ